MQLMPNYTTAKDSELAFKTEAVKLIEALEADLEKILEDWFAKHPRTEGSVMTDEEREFMFDKDLTAFTKRYFDMAEEERARRWSPGFMLPRESDHRLEANPDGTQNQ